MIRKIVLRSLLIVSFAIVGVVANNQNASALGGVGYFTGNYTCNRDSGLNRECGLPNAFYHDDVVPGRVNASSPPAMPNFGANKFAYRDWVIGQYHSGDPDRRAAARFIIGTMLGSPAMADNLAEFGLRFNNPDLTMTLQPVADPSSLGNISYRGLNEGGNLDFFWDPFLGGSPGNVYLFYIAGNPDPVYVIQQNCGNPVGMPHSMPPYNPEDWEINGGAKVRINTGNPATTPAFGGLPNGGTITASVGQTVEWELWLRNDGPTGMTTGVRYVGVRGATPTSRPGWNNNHLIGNFPNHPFQTATVGAAGDYIYGSWFDGHLPKPPTAELRFERYVIDANDVGRTICQHMAAYPRAHDNHTWFDSAPACVYVPYDYGLTPDIDVSQSSVEDPSTEFPIITRVTMDVGSTPSQPTRWRIIKLIYNVADPSPEGTGAGRTNNDPCAHFAGATNCDPTWWQSDPKDYVFTSSTSDSTNTSLGSDFDINDRVCYATAVNTPTHDPAADGAWAYSDLSCVIVAKRPKIQFWGADVRSVGDVFTNKTTLTGTDPKMYGAWAEYGIFASGVVNSSSGGGLASDAGGLPLFGAERDYNKLTFANTGLGTLPPFGSFGLTPGTEIAASLLGSASDSIVSGTTDVANLSSGSDRIRRWSAGGNLVIDGGEVPAGKTVIVNAGGTVTIRGNITYPGGTYGSFSELSQMVIIANNIVIEPGVAEVSAWLITRTGASGPGYISTCGAVTLPNWLGFDVDDCSQRLTINGPVVTNSLFLRRTFGSELGNLHEPAEILNLRPDTYLWAYYMARSTDAIKTGHTRELPPRF